MLTRQEKIAAAKPHIASRIGDIIERNFEEAGGALDTPGTFTGLLEAFRAVEIAEQFDSNAEYRKDVEDYTQGLLKNT